MKERSEDENQQRGKTWIEVLLILLLAASPYVVVLDAPFIYDDMVYVVDNNQVEDPGRLFEAFRSSYPPGRAGQGLYRPLVTASYALDHALAGFNPFVFHLTNLLLHAGATLAAYLLLRSWLPKVAFWAALLFAVHPVHTEAVAWVVGRAELLCGLLMFLALWCAPKRLSVAMVLLLLALFSKEMAITAPFLVLAPAVFLGAPLARTRKSALGFALVLFAYLAIRASALGGLTPSGSHRILQDASLWERLPALFEIYAQYFRLAFLPVGLAVDHPWEGLPSWSDAAVIAGVFLVLALVASMWILRKRQPWIALSIAWFLMALAPVSHFFPIGATYAERFLYIPSLAATVVLAGALQRLPSRNLRLGALAVLLLAGCALSVNRNQIWRDEERFYSESIEASPNSVGLNHNLGAIYAERGETDRAGEIFEAALRVREQDVTVLSNLGAIRMKQGRMAEARELLERSVSIDPRYARAQFNLAILYSVLGRVDEARGAFERTLALDPSYPKAREGLERLQTLRESVEAALVDGSRPAIEGTRFFRELLLDDSAGTARMFAPTP